MSRTATAPPTDRSMWRRLFKHVHPDASGDGELFVWAKALQEHVAGNGIEPRAELRPPRRSTTDAERVPFDPGVDFATLTEKALDFAEECIPGPYARLLHLLEDCRPAYGGPLSREQTRGASYRRLATIGHRVGMDKPSRLRWYRIAESIPLSDRHAGHILGKLSEGTA